MEQGFNLIKNKHLAKKLAIILISIALVLQTVEYVFTSIYIGFSYEDLFAFVFEIIVTSMLIFALIQKKPVLVEIALIVLKVVEGTYYPLKSCERIDLLIALGGENFNIGTHVFFTIASFSLLVALVFFCIYKYKNKIKYWDMMKTSVLIASFFMFISAIIYIIDTVVVGESNWEEVLEPVALTILFLGMFMTYEYVEEETIYNEETSAS